MDTLPEDLLGLIVSELELKEVHQLREITSEGVGKSISNILETSFYWKNLVSRSPGFLFPLEIQDFCSWKNFYTEMVYGKGEEFAVGKYFSLEMISRWVGLLLDITGSDPEFDDESGSEEDEEDKGILKSGIIAMMKGLIDSDRVDVFESILQYVTTGSSKIMDYEDFDYPSYIIASDGGWNILITYIPHLLNRPNHAQEYLGDSLRSSDIAHYLLLRSLFETDIRPSEHDLSIIVKHAPQNLGFYLRIPEFSLLLESEIDWLIDAIIRSSIRLNSVHKDLLKQFIGALSMQQYSDVWKGLLGTSLNSKVAFVIIKLMLQDPKGSPERLLKVFDSLFHQGIDLPSFKDTLGFPISYYMGLTNEEGKYKLIRVLMSQSGLPHDKRFQAFFDVLRQDYQYNLLIEKGRYLKSVFTWDETRELAQLILSTYNTKSSNNYKRLVAIYDRVF